MEKKVYKATDLNKLAKMLVDFYSKKNYLHVDDFKEMVKKATKEIKITKDK